MSFSWKPLFITLSVAFFHLYVLSPFCLLCLFCLFCLFSHLSDALLSGSLDTPLFPVPSLLPLAAHLTLHTQNRSSRSGQAGVRQGSPPPPPPTAKQPIQRQSGCMLPRAAHCRMHSCCCSHGVCCLGYSPSCRCLLLFFSNSLPCHPPLPDQLSSQTGHTDSSWSCPSAFRLGPSVS